MKYVVTYFLRLAVIFVLVWVFIPAHEHDHLAELFRMGFEFGELLVRAFFSKLGFVLTRFIG